MAESAWLPLRNRLFRALWLAALASNVGTFMQTVGAQWLLVSGPHAALLVSLVQTADMVPDLVFGVVGGVLADILDRRRLLIAVQVGLAIVGAILTVLTYAHLVGPVLLLTFTFLLGFGSAFSNPAYQAIIPSLVPRNQLPAAAALGSISVNIARAAGPAVAGLMISRVGVGAVFALNTAAYVAFAIVVLFWHSPEAAAAQLPEPFMSALLAGGRYVRHSPVVRRLLLRVALFLVPASALWALLPVVASQQLATGAAGYGLMLASLGIGAIVGALFLSRLTALLPASALIGAASGVFGLAIAALSEMRSPLWSYVLLVPAGVAWVVVLSTINAALQLFLPAWVRARGLSIYLMVFFGAQAVGATLFGIVAGPLGLKATLLIASAALVVGAAATRLWPLIDTSAMNQALSTHWAEPRLTFVPDRDAGPVVVRNVYTVALENEAEFLGAMPQLRLSRMRTGAIQWGIFRDGEQPRAFVELFVVPSWDEHLRQHNDRLTHTDRMIEEAAVRLSNPPPQTSHLIPARIDE